MEEIFDIQRFYKKSLFSSGKLEISNFDFKVWGCSLTLNPPHYNNLSVLGVRAEFFPAVLYGLILRDQTIVLRFVL